MRNRLTWALIIVGLIVGSLLFISQLSNAQVPNAHNLTGVQREVASPTTGSYGKILKWNPITGLWTAQNDSVGTMTTITTDSLAVIYVRASGDTLYFRTKASVWMMKLTGTNVNFAADPVVANITAWMDSTNFTNDGIGNEDLAVNSVSTTEIRDATIDSVDVKDASLAVGDISNGANGFALKLAMTDSLVLRLLKTAWIDSLNAYISTYAKTYLDDANESTLKATLNLEAGTDYNAYSVNMDTDGTDDMLKAAFPDSVVAGIARDTTKQAADATLTDIADGTIAENLVNTANPWADNEIASSSTWNAAMPASAFPDSMNNPHSDIDINGGAIDGTPIGANTKSTAAFTTLSADSSFTVSHGTPWDMTDGQYQGQLVVAKAHEALIFGNVCFMNTDGEYAKADADSVETMPGLVMALASIGADAYGLFLQTGYICESDWTTVQTKGALVYVGNTPGLPTTTAPTGAADQVQVLGYCIGTDIMYFRSDWTLVEVPTP